MVPKVLVGVFSNMCIAIKDDAADFPTDLVSEHRNMEMNNFQQTEGSCFLIFLSLCLEIIVVILQTRRSKLFNDRTSQLPVIFRKLLKEIQ